MNTRSYTVGRRTFTFPFYRDKVAVNVKCHHVPEPVSPEARDVWQHLSEEVKDTLRSYAFEAVQEWWWDAIREELPLDVEAEGRSGGYAALSKITDSYLCQVEDDADAEGCDSCILAGAKEHHDGEAYHEGPQLPLPFENAIWNHSCIHCKQPYSEHVGYHCPMHLGSTYQPHAYTNSSLQSFAEVQIALDILEQRASDKEIERELNLQLDWQIEQYQARREEADTGTEK